MSKVAFIFPGQGAQHTGMGMDLFERSEDAKALFEKADALLDFDLMDLMNNEAAPIHETAYTQPALVAVSVAYYNEFKKQTDIKPDYVAGLSLGEYTAHVAANSLAFEDALKLVRKRGLYMEEAGKETKGAMAAVIKGDIEQIDKYCREDRGIVGIANYNSPLQIVISGEEAAVKRVSAKLSEEGVRVVPLQVSGAFHSPLMASAAEKLDLELQNIHFEPMEIKHVTNVTGETVESHDAIKGLLIDQLSGSVQWEKSVKYMIENGVDTFIEIGPGKTLAGLVKKINRKVKVYNVNTYQSIEEVKAKVKGE